MKGLSAFSAAKGDFQEQEGLLQTVLLEFHFNILHDRAQSWWIWTNLTPMTNVVQSLKTWSLILCLLLDSIFSGLDILQKVSQEKSFLDARHQAVVLRPGGHWCSFIPPRNGHKVKVISDHLANACLPGEVIQTSPCWLTAKPHLFYSVFHK